MAQLASLQQKKLAFRSTRCVFLGYSPRHKGVKCLDVSSGRVYIYRDVVFDEAVYHFASLHKNAGALLRSQIMLLPSQNCNLQHGDKLCDDFMPNTTPADSYVSLQNQQVPRQEQPAAENFIQNDANHAQNCAEMDEDIPGTPPHRDMHGARTEDDSVILAASGSATSAQ